MLLNAAAVEAAAAGFRALYNKSFEVKKVFYEEFCIIVESTHAIEHHAISGGVAPMRQWSGDRQVQNLVQYLLSLENQDYELTVGVDRNHYEDDTLSAMLVSGDFASMGAAAKAAPDRLFADLLVNGFTDLGPDGVAFFSASHPTEVGTTLSNTSTDALDATAFELGVDNFYNLTNAFGLEISPLDDGGELCLIVPPQLRSTARAIVELPTLSGGGDNPNFKLARLVVNPYLRAHATKWFLGISNGPRKGMVHQWRRKPQMVVLNKPTDQNVFRDRQILHGVDGRWAMGYGEWRCMFGSTGVS